MTRNQILVISALAAALTGMPSRAAAQDPDQPETVLVTLHAKPGAEGALARVLARHWSTARALRLVRKTPHITMRTPEDGNKTCFVEIFSWRDARIPDAAPAAIRALWAQMNGLVESRDGKPGLGFQAVSLVSGK